MFFDKGTKVSNFMILRLITAFEKKLFSCITTSSLFVISVLSSSLSELLIIPHNHLKSYQKSFFRSIQIANYVVLLVVNSIFLFFNILFSKSFVISSLIFPKINSLVTL